MPPPVGEHAGLSAHNPYYAYTAPPPSEPIYPPYRPRRVQPNGEPHGAPPYAMHEPPMAVHPASPPMRYAPEPMDYMLPPRGGPDVLPPPMHDDLARPPMLPMHDVPMHMEPAMHLPPRTRERAPAHAAPVPVPMPPSPRRVHASVHSRSHPRRSVPLAGPNGEMVSSSASKRDRKRKEVLERLERTHWEGLENRDAVFHEAYVALTSMYHALLTHPTHVREFAIAMADRTLERDAALREAALYHAFRLERSQNTFAAERTKVDDEARLAKRSVRDKLLHVIEDRKRRLREEKEGGEFAADFLLERSQRQHSTRQLRNKGAAAATPALSLARHSALHLDDESEGSTHALSTAVAQLLHWSELDASAAIAAASAQGGDMRALPITVANGETVNMSLHEVFASHASLLAGVNLSMAAAAANAAANASKNKKKGAKPSHAQVLANAERTLHADEDESQTGAGPLPTTPFLSTGGGRLRWDTAKCLSQLTGAKDIEVESDLINIHKIGNKRRRR